MFSFEGRICQNSQTSLSATVRTTAVNHQPDQGSEPAFRLGGPVASSLFVFR